MQGLDDHECKNGKAEIQNQCGVVAFFETTGFLCAEILGNVGRNGIADGYKDQGENILYPIVAEYPASACVPKGFTTACTIIIPMDTVDCCKIDGTARRSMDCSSCPSNQ